MLLLEHICSQDKAHTEWSFDPWKNEEENIDRKVKTMSVVRDITLTKV
jgi:hypothetical protein